MSSNRDHAVVTGGGGFVGSHLTEALLNAKRRVTVLDNFGSGRPENLESNQNEHLEVLQSDIRDPLPSLTDIDELYHFASRASPEDFSSHAVEIALTNSEGTRNVLDTAREHNAKTILASTSEIYGDPMVHPQHEQYNGNVNIRGPRAPYDEGKRFSEALAVAYEQQYGIDVRTVRIFNTYGPRMRTDDGRVIPNFLRQALSGDDLTVYGDGTQTRSFCYVSDLVRGILAVAEAPSDQVAGEAINLGSTDEIEIRTLATRVLDIIETDTTLTYESLPQDDPSQRCPDITKAKELLEWEPKVTLDDGLRRTVEDFRERV
jgi:UDP-glucuronate decarboxylase